jgi:hypothetical protein
MFKVFRLISTEVICDVSSVFKKVNTDFPITFILFINVTLNVISYG